MSKKWWGIIIASFLAGATLVGVGSFLFDTASFLENLIAEAIGLTFALGIVVWLIEGPVLTRERRIRAILEYKRRVFRIAWEIGSQSACDIAELISNDFEPEIDLYGHERGRWNEFKPLLRAIFRLASNVRKDGLPSYPSLDEETARSIMTGCRHMEERIRREIDTKPELAKWEVLGGVDMYLRMIAQSIERSERLSLLDDEITRYEKIGELGDLLLDMTDAMTPLEEGSGLW